jgi:hypothetical protein
VFLLTGHHWLKAWEPVLPLSIAVLLAAFILSGNRVGWVVAVVGTCGQLLISLVLPAFPRVPVPGIGTLDVARVLWLPFLLQTASGILLLTPRSRQFAGTWRTKPAMAGVSPPPNELR